MNNITVGPVQAGYGAAGNLKPGSVEEKGFGEVLKKSLDAVSSQASEANALAEGLISGQHANIHETMIAMEKSSISFKLMTKAHRKAIEAYQEMMRMQL